VKLHLYSIIYFHGVVISVLKIRISRNLNTCGFNIALDWNSKRYENKSSENAEISARTFFITRNNIWPQGITCSGIFFYEHK